MMTCEVWASTGSQSAALQERGLSSNTAGGQRPVIAFENEFKRVLFHLDGWFGPPAAFEDFAGYAEWL
jgi:hypothetical protein